MIHEQKIEISLNKKKLTNGFITCTGFGILGILLFILSTDNKYPVFDNQFVKYGAVVISVLFFSFGILFFWRKLTGKKPGILIDDKGIQYNSNAFSVGFINWNDVKQFTKATAMKQEFLVVEVNNPEYYINKQTNFIVKKGLKSNFKHYGSPLAISTGLLNCSLNELITILEKRLLSRHDLTTATNTGFGTMAADE